MKRAAIRQQLQSGSGVGWLSRIRPQFTVALDSLKPSNSISRVDKNKIQK